VPCYPAVRPVGYPVAISPLKLPVHLQSATAAASWSLPLSSTAAPKMLPMRCQPTAGCCACSLPGLG
jgi:hypothetical protein